MNDEVYDGEKIEEEFAEFISALSKKIKEDQKTYLYEHEIKYPLEISGVKGKITPISKGFAGHNYGTMVAVKPCNDVKTFLGMYLGEVPVTFNTRYNKETKELEVVTNNNPAIYVPDLDKIVYGIESWWGVIKNEEQLKDITDEDIDNVWYVKALKELNKDG